MNRKTTVIAVIAGILVLISGALYLSVKEGFNLNINPETSNNPSMESEEASQASSTVIVGDIFQLEFTDLANNKVSLSDFTGRPLIVNSWATWCTFCINELPNFTAAQKEFGDQVVIIAINRRESPETSKEFTDNLDISDGIIYLLDPKDDFYKTIGGFGMPETLFINSAGQTIIHKRGPMDLNEIRSKIQEII